MLHIPLGSINETESRGAGRQSAQQLYIYISQMPRLWSVHPTPPIGLMCFFRVWFRHIRSLSSGGSASKLQIMVSRTKLQGENIALLTSSLTTPMPPEVYSFVRAQKYPLARANEKSCISQRPCSCSCVCAISIATASTRSLDMVLFVLVDSHIDLFEESTAI